MDTAWAQLQAYTKTYTSSSLAERVDDDGKKQQQHAAERSSRPGRLAPRCRRAAPAREPTRPQQPLALASPASRTDAMASGPLRLAAGAAAPAHKPDRSLQPLARALASLASHDAMAGGSSG